MGPRTALRSAATAHASSRSLASQLLFLQRPSSRSIASENSSRAHLRTPAPSCTSAAAAAARFFSISASPRRRAPDDGKNGDNMSAPPTKGQQGQEGQQEGELPKFSFAGLGMSQGMRRALVAVLVVLACIESAAWIKFLPRMMGWGD